MCKINRLGGGGWAGEEGYLFGGRGRRRRAVLAGILRSDEWPRNGRPGGWRVARLVDVAGGRELLCWGVHSQIQGGPGGLSGVGGSSWTRRRPAARWRLTSAGPVGSPCSSETPCKMASSRPGTRSDWPGPRGARPSLRSGLLRQNVYY